MLVTAASVLRMVIVMSALRIGVIRMKNKEKYAKEILDIACSGKLVTVNKHDRIAACINLKCEDCKFGDKIGIGCGMEMEKWAESEYIKKPGISKRDRAFLEYLKEEYKCIARDENACLFVYKNKPMKVGACWNSSGLNCECYLHLDRHFNIDFPMVKWLDEEPWLIEDLRKLEVVDSYE